MTAAANERRRRAAATASQTQFTKLELARLTHRAELAVGEIFRRAALEAAAIISEQAIGGKLVPSSRAAILDELDARVIKPIFGARKGARSPLRALVERAVAEAESLADETVRAEIDRQISDPGDRALLHRAFGLPDEARP